VQELMAESDIVISERVDVEVRTDGVVDLTVERTVDLTVAPDAALGSVASIGPVVDREVADRDNVDRVDSQVVDREDDNDVEDDEDEDEDGDNSVGAIGHQSVDLVLVETDDLPPELAWQERALCAQTDPEAFFPEKGGSTREAKRVCMSCEVRAECLDYALAKDERFGIWGGLSERERRRVKKQAV
jgi:WhiB family transcriptional regulator, redox-sensing transcriptional regulator